MANGMPGNGDVAAAARRKGHQRRMTNGLVGISAAAIVAVYAAGYLNTRADDDISVMPALPTVTAAASTATASPTPFVQRAERDRRFPGEEGRTLPGGSVPGGGLSPSQAQPQPQATPTMAPKKAGTYRDGTYTGMGTSRHGSIQATVVIEGGTIVSANISSCQTRYPCSKVASLVNETVARQAVPVDYVSGSTDSSRAYATAVANALAQAG